MNIPNVTTTAKARRKGFNMFKYSNIMTLEEIEARMEYLDEIFTNNDMCGYTDDKIEAHQAEISKEWLELNEMKKDLEKKPKQ